MQPKQDPHIVIISEYPAIGAALTMLLSSLSRRITACSDYHLGLRVVEQELSDSRSGALPLLFIAAAPKAGPNADYLETIMALIATQPQSMEVIFMVERRLEAEVKQRFPSVMHHLITPITSRNLSKVLHRLGIEKTKLNCWEYKGCGREPAGEHVADLGVCPASITTKTDGTNDGDNGGRACWAVTGTLCDGVVNGSFAAKIGNCMDCDFYKIVLCEEGDHFESINTIFRRLDMPD